MFTLSRTLNMVSRQPQAQLLLRSAFQANFATSSLVGTTIGHAPKIEDRSKFTLRTICSTRCQYKQLLTLEVTCKLDDTNIMDQECCQVMVTAM